MPPGYSDRDCIHYCFENNSCPDDWPDPTGRNVRPPCWISHQQVLPANAGITVQNMRDWKPSNFVTQDGSEKCKCIESVPGDNCSLERLSGSMGNVSTPGYGDSPCKVGEAVLAKYKGVCQGPNANCCDGDRGACEVLVLWVCRSNRNNINNWVSRRFKGKCK